MTLSVEVHTKTYQLRRMCALPELVDSSLPPDTATATCLAQALTQILKFFHSLYVLFQTPFHDWLSCASETRLSTPRCAAAARNLITLARVRHSSPSWFVYVQSGNCVDSTLTSSCSIWKSAIWTLTSSSSTRGSTNALFNSFERIVQAVRLQSCGRPSEPPRVELRCLM